MIKFFRKFRQNSIKESRVSKYLLYAIGEIVLVVIGILLALQINIWNENQKNKKVEITYLKGIMSDLDGDIYDLNDLVYIDSSRMRAFTTVLNAFTDKKIANSPALVKAIARSNVSQVFEGNSIVFEDMKSSGKINFITSDILRFAILKYYKNSHEVMKNQNEYANPQYTELAAKAFNTNVDLNSLVEGFMFSGELSAELDELDFSFFEKDIKSKEVQDFANRISMMKAVTKLNHENNITLLYSAEKLKTEITDYLTSQGVMVKNEVPKETLTAIKSGDTGYLKRMITAESLNDCFDMEFETGNYLVHCIMYQSLESLQFFVEKGAYLESVCENKTPLMYAVKYGELDMVKYLVEQGADLKANNNGKTPLDYAKAYEHPQVEAYLISVNAD